ncbi:hypothetical protein Tco_0955382 [Tanacetum coccineum]|uniref:Uncharacterized protein n=1 Tax=Tanacetum coccineum TaxID=301880 RepID=A0ABQ5E745_9ASTR
MYLVNKDLFYLMNRNSKMRKYVLSLHKIHVFPFLKNDLEELNTRWEIVVKRVDGDYSSFSKSDYKYLHKNDIEDMYLMCMNGKIKYQEIGILKSLIVFIGSNVIWERVHGYQLSLESYQLKVNLMAPKLTFPSIKEKKSYTITSLPFVGLIYDNIKKVKRIMIVDEIPKFCNVMLKRVLKEVKKINLNVKHGYANPPLNKEDAEFMVLYKEYILECLRHQDPMRCWDSYVNGRPL